MVLAAAAASGLRAQAPDQSSEQTFRAGIELVELDVSVLDKNRQPVRGLNAASFTIQEDGKRRPVAAFSFIDASAASVQASGNSAPGATNGVAPTRGIGEGRLVVVVMDRSIPSGTPTLIARRTAAAAISQMGPGDLGAIVYTGSGLVEDITGNRERLLARVTGIQPAADLGAAARGAWEIQNDRLEIELQRPGDTLPRVLPDFDISGDCMCGLCVLETIAHIADALRDLARRSKSLLFIGTDIVMESTVVQCTGKVRDARAAMMRAVDATHLTVHAFDAAGLETLAIDASSGVQGRDLTSTANQRPGALPAIPAAHKKLLVRQGNLAVLPGRTGGRTILNTNDPDLVVPDVFKETSSYYLLGFVPGSPADGKRHDISVKVDRRGVDVSTRRNYIRPAATKD